MRELARDEVALLVFLFAAFAFTGVRLIGDPPTVAGAGPFVGGLYLAAAMAMTVPLLAPRARTARAFAGATAILAPSARALLLLLESIADPGAVPGLADSLVAVASWSAVAAMLLFVWVRLPLPPRRP